MKINNIVSFLVAVFFLAPSYSYSQSTRLMKAYEEFNAGHYSTAVDMLRRAYNTPNTGKEEQATILFRIGECYRLIDQPLRAESWYIKAIAKGYQDPVVHLRLGEIKKMNQKYADAREEFKNYKEKAPGDRRADDGMRSCDFAISAIENGNGYVVNNMKFFNSRRQSDFSPVFASDDYSVIYLTSSRDAATGESINSVTGEKFSDIFVSRMDRKQAWSQPVPIDGDVNTEVDEGSCSFTPDFRTMYFTRCRSNANKAWGCQIVSAQMINDRWTREKVIEIASDSVVIAHPAISPDESVLYFVSDMPGGQGGKDIWKVTRAGDSDNWGRPENLGTTINTANDEMFPYVHPDGTLYFSSNGHIGMGGLDIFKARYEGGNWTVENMGFPINSPADDFGIAFHAEEERGYFTSSRTPQGDDDIYAFSLPPLSFTLTGLVKDEKTDQPLPDATVRIISSDGRTNEIQTNNNGSFTISLNSNTDYVFTASKQSYLNGKAHETTKGNDRSKNFTVEIPLTSIVQPVEIPNIFYDFARWDLRPESMVSLDRLVEILNDNLNITIELGSHTDSRGGESDNQTLSQRRAQSVVDYLIEKGIASDRLTAKGYGESTPKVVTDQMAAQYPFLRNGITLTETYINSLPSRDDQEIAHQFNRRTEFRVLRTDYNSN